MPPPRITPEIFEQVCDELMFGVKSLRQCCESVGITHGHFLLYLKQDAALASRYMLAREIGDDAAHDRLREKLQEKPVVAEDGRVDQGWVQWNRLQTDTLKWELSKRWPRKYGDKVEQMVTGFEGGPLESRITIEFVKSEFLPVERGEGWKEKAIEAELSVKPVLSEISESSDPSDSRSRDFTLSEWGLQ